MAVSFEVETKIGWWAIDSYNIKPPIEDTARLLDYVIKLAIEKLDANPDKTALTEFLNEINAEMTCSK